MKKVRYVHYTNADSFTIPCEFEYAFHEFYEMLRDSGFSPEKWDEGIPFKITIETMGNRYGQAKYEEGFGSVGECPSCASQFASDELDDLKLNDNRCFFCNETIELEGK